MYYVRRWFGGLRALHYTNWDAGLGFSLGVVHTLYIVHGFYDMCIWVSQEISRYIS